MSQTFNIFLCEFSKEKCSKQQHYVILRLHGKSNSAIISEEMLLEANLIFVIYFTREKILEKKIYTEKTRKLRQNTQKIASFFALLQQNTQ